MSTFSKKIIFTAKNLTKIYKMGEVDVVALKSINLELYEGEIVVFLGPSGSGKSTLLNILGGLDSASSGEVFYCDHNLVQSSRAELTNFRRDHVGFVFQFYNLIPSLTAEENVSLVTDICQQSMSAFEALTLVGLKDRANHFPSQLSGGEQQRVAVARAVAKRPNILLCDEPTGALDLSTGKKVLESIIKVNEELKSLVAIITHNSAIASIADRVIHLTDGQIRLITKNIKRATLDEVIW